MAVSFPGLLGRAAKARDERLSHSLVGQRCGIRIKRNPQTTLVPQCADYQRTSILCDSAVEIIWYDIAADRGAKHGDYVCRVAQKTALGLHNLLRRFMHEIIQRLAAEIIQQKLHRLVGLIGGAQLAN